MAPPEDCIEHTLDFIIRDTDPDVAVVEDDIRAHLAEIGITVNTKLLDRLAYNEAEKDGTYNILFSRTWGAPYDPHSYFSSWSVPSHVEYSAVGNLDGSLTRDQLLAKIENVQKLLDPTEIYNAWAEIHREVHQQAIFLPLWGSRVPYVFNRRLDNFVPSPQANTYPLKGVSVSGSPTVTIAVGSNNGLFKSVGIMNPHLYAPNQIFVNDWIYEGLVRYGQDGVIGPALAKSWQTEYTAEGQRVTFQLQEGVKFHDGTDWNCAVAKLNLDHILSDIVRERHSWYGTPNHLKSWTCNDNDELVLETSVPFYPLLQELSYSRPIVFASAAAFAQGIDSDPDLHNSCNPGGFGSSWKHLEEEVTCLGLTGPYGTGPFKFVSREYLPGSNDEIDAEVVFAAHEDYWGGAPQIKTLIIKHFDNTDDVYNALMSDQIDMALGIGPLTSKQVRDIAFYNSTKFDVVRGEVLQNAVLVMNTNKEPTDDINVRKAIFHAINKADFIASEFAGLEQPVDQLLPYTAPYCDIDLHPKWDYDLEKAMLINCPASDDDGLSGGAIAGIVVAALVVLGLVGLIFTMIGCEKSGKPMFAPEHPKVEEAVPS